MKHIVVFLAYENFDMIKKSFNSLKNSNSDFFIIENFSKNSNSIKEFFIKEKLIGYIQFLDNARANAVNIFIEKYYDLLSQYDYVTITDGDLFIYDIADTFKEIILSFNDINCYVCGVTLYKGNNYENNPNRIIGTEHYVEHMLSKSEHKIGPIKGRTGNHLLTFNKKSLNVIKDVHYIDSNIFLKIKNLGGSCYRTTKNLAYHLTWDLYFDGNPYYENKKNNLKEIWAKSNDNFMYNQII
jgi:hypothetical protein